MRPMKIAVSMALIVASLGLLIWAFAPEASAVSSTAKSTTGDGIWETANARALPIANLSAAPGTGGSRSVVRLNKEAFAQRLAKAPMEGAGDLRNSPLILSLPMSNGSFQRFYVEESPMMEPSLAARLTGVKTYRGLGLDDPTASTRFDITPKGFHALVLSGQGSTYIEPASAEDTTNYVAHSGEASPDKVFKCGVTEAEQVEAEARLGRSQSVTSGAVTNSVTNGSTLRTYRLAIATTGEWYGLYSGGSVAGAQTAIATIINLVDAIYEREVAIHFNLVNNTNIIFTNPSTDPYTTNAADSNTLSQNQTTLDNPTYLGSGNYDVGHVFGGITGLGAGSGSFSGLAVVGVTCNSSSKAQGVSTMGNNPASITEPIFVGGVAHEIGHEFSATHTFNANTSGCSGQRTAASAYEVGSGSTLMSYSTCGSENLQQQDDHYFHVRSLEQITSYATNSGVCASTGATGNNAPIVTGPGNFTIPANTPFQLTGSASDTNGSLTYSWEEYDLGAASPPDTDDGSRPIFRSYPPVTTPIRYFPSLTYILSNANVPPTTNSSGFLTGESLPTTSRTLNFQLVVRDNLSNGGAVNTVTSVLTVNNAAGPFAVASPNGGESWSGPHNITWNVANTTSAPVSTANVKISLSTDGGQSFPYVLAPSVPNTGTASVTLPNGILSSTCRVKVEAVGNIYFDISDANFSLSPGDTCPAISNISPKAGVVGSSVVITGINFTGVNAVTFSNNVAASFTVNNSTTITATVPAGAAGGAITLHKPGCGSLPSSSYNFCSGGPVAIAIDDGSDESASEVSANNVYYVNRLTPINYPATLSQISIYWDSSFTGFPPGTAINVVAGNVAPSNMNINGTSFQSFAATAGSSGFTTYTLPNPLTISTGDFVVGFQVPVYPAGTFPVVADVNNPASRSYYSGDGTNFATAGAVNYMIRASQVFTGCSAGTPSLKILSITKAPNGHVILQCLGVPNIANDLQASTDLSSSFTPLAPAPSTADNAGSFQYDDAAAGFTKRFYRLAYP